MRKLRLLAPALAVGLMVAALTWAGAAWNASRVPAVYGVMDFGAADFGGGPDGQHVGHHHGIIVADLRETATGPPDVRVTLVAQHAKVRVPSGKSVNVLSFNATVPGPEIRVRLGQLVEITLVNRDVDEGVSIHWHGVDVPNAEDGVAGVTQDAVPVGGRYVYRFRANQPGTYWYHSHQHSVDEVKRGLYGAFVVVPPDEPAETADLTLVAHRLPGARMLGSSDLPEQRAIAPGTPVRLRLVNTDNSLRRFALGGTPFRVAAIDGGEIYLPSLLREETLEVGAGARYDLLFTMPDHAVTLGLRNERLALALSPDGASEPVEPRFGPTFDPAAYGVPHAGDVRPGTRFDRTFVMRIGRRLGFHAGGFKLGWQWTVNGKTFPDMPMLVVGRDELVKIVFDNHSGADHPMHLHGHHMLVIARDGRPVKTPWLVDVLNVKPGERYDVAVKTVNPGLWMLHCHNLQHAAQGFMSHLVYDGVRTPFQVGDDTPNTPE